jgi:hemerythrin
MADKTNMTHSIYGAGHTNLDRDHALLFDILVKLKSADLNRSDVPALANQLVAYLDAHFEHEELLMDRYGYPDAMEHKRAHSHFRAEAISMLRGCSAPEASRDVLSLSIEQWLENHTRMDDRVFANFLNSFDVEKVGANFGVYAAVEEGAPDSHSIVK